MTVNVLNKQDIYENVFKLLEGVTLKKRVNNTNRRNFPVYRGAIYGMVRPRFKYDGKLQLSIDSKKHPEIFKELVRIGNIIAPKGFKFNSIQVNKNLQSPPHIDSKNVGNSMLVSVGNYEGCNLVINGKEYNTKNKPVIFNGAELEHYNTPLISGTKYSIIYFTTLNR